MEELTTLETLDKALARHDWFYEYSDDHRVWCQGRDALANIGTLMSKAKAEGFGDEAGALYAKHRPANY
jgi:hypothetical protein